MSEVDRQIARSKEVIARANQRNATPRTRRTAAARAARAIKYAVGGVGMIALIAIVWGLITPIGTTGVMIAFLAMLATMCLAIMLSREPEVSFDTLAQSDLKSLPATTERWLHSQRPAMPAPAVRLVDGIGVKLETLQSQVQFLDPREPVALEVRRLIADDLPELVKGYTRVPQHLRAEGLNGMSPDKQLLDGLGVVDSELDRLSEQLATGDLNTLATQGRYLELKYQGDSER